MEGAVDACNMTWKFGARPGMVAPDADTFGWVSEGGPRTGGADFGEAREQWSRLAFRVEMRRSIAEVPVDCRCARTE